MNRWPDRITFAKVANACCLVRLVFLRGSSSRIGAYRHFDVVMRFSILILLFAVARPCFGAGLEIVIHPSPSTGWPRSKVLGASHNDPVERKKVYDHYIESEFADIAPELAKRVSENPVLQGYIPKEQLAEPWTHSMALTLSHAWRFHTDYAIRKEPLGKIFEVLMAVVEDDAVDGGRHIALREIATRMHWGNNPVTDDHSLPPIEDTIRRLSSIAQDEREDAVLRRAIVPILYEYGDPNAYLDLAIKLTSGETSPLGIAEAFRFATPVRGSDRLSPGNRAKYLNYGFTLLKEVDDQKSGHGYFMAMHLGHVAGVKPIVKGESPFKPDQSLRKYQGEHGLKDSFFQTTVDNAIKWWAANKNKYRVKQSAPRRK